MLNNIIKDLKVNIFDGKQMLIIIAMPVVLTIILSFALGGTFSSEGLSEPIDVAIVKQYDSDINNDDILNTVVDTADLPPQAIAAYEMQIETIDPEGIFFNDFLELDDVKGIISYEVLDEKKAQEALNDGDVKAIVYLPENFITATYANMFGEKEQVKFDITVDAGSSYKGRIASQVMTAFTDSFSLSFANGEVFNEISADYISEHEASLMIGQFYEKMDELASNVATEIRSETVEQYAPVDSFTYYTAAMLCMFMLFSAGIGGRSMLEEKDNLTYYRMKSLGVTYFQMMISKMVVVMIICLLQSAVMIGLSSMLFGVEWGDFTMVVIIALCGSFAIGGLGSFIGSISLRSGNYKLANAFEGALVQILALLGGSYIPLSVLPKFFTKMSKFTVNGQALSAYLKTAQGMGINDIFTELLIILLFGAAFFAAAWVLISAEGRKENV